MRVEFPSQMALCGAPTAAPTDGGSRRGNRQKWSFLLPVFRTGSDSVNSVSSHVRQCHLDTQHPVFVYSIWVHACCVSDLTSCQRSAVFTCEEEEFETQKYREPNRQIERGEHKSMNH